MLWRAHGCLKVSPSEPVTSQPNKQFIRQSHQIPYNRHTISQWWSPICNHRTTGCSLVGVTYACMRLRCNILGPIDLKASQTFLPLEQALTPKVWTKFYTPTKTPRKFSCFNTKRVGRLAYEVFQYCILVSSSHARKQSRTQKGLPPQLLSKKKTSNHCVYSAMRYCKMILNKKI